MAKTYNLKPCTESASAPQVMAAHKDFLSRLLTGFLLSKRIIVLRKLIDLKALAADFSKLSERLRIDTQAFEVEFIDAATGAPAAAQLRVLRVFYEGL